MTENNTGPKIFRLSELNEVNKTLENAPINKK